MKLTKALSSLFNRIKEMQPVSEARLGVLNGPAKRVFRSLLLKGLVAPAGKVMLGTNWTAVEELDRLTNKITPENKPDPVDTDFGPATGLEQL